MFLSSVIRASHWFMADERIRQSMKSLRIFLSLMAVSRVVFSCILMMFTVSSYASALIPLITLSAGIFPAAVYFAPIAESSNMVILLMKIWCPSRISLIGASFGRFLTEMPMAGRKYVVSSRSFKIQPSWIVLF